MGRGVGLVLLMASDKALRTELAASGTGIPNWEEITRGKIGAVSRRCMNAGASSRGSSDVSKGNDRSIASRKAASWEEPLLGDAACILRTKVVVAGGSLAKDNDCNEKLSLNTFFDRTSRRSCL